MTKPRTKIGIAISTRLTSSTVASKSPPLRRPAMTPKPMPKMPSKASAMTASLKVTGKARAITSITGRPENELPKFSVRAPLMYS